MWWYVYILESARDGERYVGLTNDLKRRILEHNQGKSLSTRQRTPFILVYSEAHRNKYDAAAREQFLKTGWGKKLDQAYNATLSPIQKVRREELTLPNFVPKLGRVKGR